VIDLSFIEIGVDGVRAIAEALKVNSTLLKVYFHDNGIGSGGAQAIAEALRFNSVLREISLSNNWIGDEGAVAIAEAMEFNSSLQEIEIDDNRFEWTKYNLINQALEGCGIVESRILAFGCVHLLVIGEQSSA
jgi:hypothetical protein